jgi:lactoylglutathione lyase
LPVRATSLNHVSVSARKLEESVRFYRELFGLRPIPTPNFGFPVQWLQVGDLQLHLFERDAGAPRYHHFALTVDDFTALYEKASELGIFDRETFGHHVYELPGNCAQMYVRDPAGNCVEIDCRDAAGIDRSVVTELRPLANPQSEENRRATLFSIASA